TMATAVCAEFSNEIIRIVPQLNDYLCPVCFSISYKPVRLTCGHVFCIRCMIRMQRGNARYCPLCRNDVIMGANSGELLHIRCLFDLVSYSPVVRWPSMMALLDLV